MVQSFFYMIPIKNCLMQIYNLSPLLFRSASE